MSSTYCNQSWNWYIVHLHSMKYQFCCLAPIRDVMPENDWFDSTEMRERRSAHLNDVQHKDCDKCWVRESKGLASKRQLTGQVKRGDGELASSSGAHLEILLNNTCDLACRYCSPFLSSIWAQRRDHPKYNKQGIRAMKDDPVLAKKREDFINWVIDNKSRFSKIRLTGGEVALMPEFYNLLDRLQLHNKEITILSNLNTEGAHIERFINALQKLIDNGNVVNVRVSIDGVGASQEWQRQYSDWSRMEKNWQLLGQMNLRLLPAITLTPLTLESMKHAIKWTADNAKYCRKKPRWVRTSIVSYPNELAPDLWYGCYTEEITESLQSLCDDRIDGIKLAREMITWIKPSILPDTNTAESIVQFLDNQQTTWGGKDWRSVYPKMSDISSTLLNGKKLKVCTPDSKILDGVRKNIMSAGIINDVIEEEFEG